MQTFEIAPLICKGLRILEPRIREVRLALVQKRPKLWFDPFNGFILKTLKQQLNGRKKAQKAQIEGDPDAVKFTHWVKAPGAIID